jgi:phenylpropionate dioxygenase-like ring-hydroxylating dioxygenase large terminal subunit
LRAFGNVCRHRAGPVARGSGCKTVHRCGYHGWTYALDGRLMGILYDRGRYSVKRENGVQLFHMLLSEFLS